MFTHFVANSEKCRKYAFLGGSTQIITILHRGGSLKFITILQGGGLPDLLQYYKGEGGVSRDPKFVLRNIWTAPNENLEGFLPSNKVRELRATSAKCSSGNYS